MYLLNSLIFVDLVVELINEFKSSFKSSLKCIIIYYFIIITYCIDRIIGQKFKYS